MDKIDRLLVHLKVKPTYEVINTLYVILNNNGYKDVPLFKSNNNYIDQEDINKYCDKILKLLKNSTTIDDEKKNQKDVYIYPESYLLPQNVYISEKNDDEKLEDNLILGDISENSNSENELSEIEEIDEGGYEIYQDDSSEFSE